jgi:teichuronic acid biosynthesis glycosyltransferase TuaC
MLDIVTVTTLFPSSAQPQHGLFVEERLRHLTATAGVRARVVAPVPWFPARGARFGRYAVYARVPRHESWQGFDVSHPRFLAVPRIGEPLLPAAMAVSVLRELRRLQRSGGDFDLIDAQFVYPDGVAAALAAGVLGKPFVLTARGSDVNDFGTRALPRAMIRWAARASRGVIAVSAALADALAALGVERERLHVLRNGVDLVRFRPEGRDNDRRTRSGFTLLSVGTLKELKGHHLAIEALRELPDARLVIAGEGPQRAQLERLASDIGVASRVELAGPVPRERMPSLYAAADALVLASRSEGMPNVVLESLACGVPVIAAAVGGIPEVLRDPVAGILMHERSVAAVVAAVRELRAEPRAPGDVRRYAESLGWGPTIAGQLDVFRDAVDRAHRHRGGGRARSSEA